MQIPLINNILQKFGLKEKEGEEMQNAELPSPPTGSEALPKGEPMQNCEAETCENEAAESKFQAEAGTKEAEATIPEAPSREAIPDTRAHLTSSVPRAAKAPIGVLTKQEIGELRAIFAGLSDSEIQRLYKKVTKQN